MKHYERADMMPQAAWVARATAPGSGEIKRLADQGNKAAKKTKKLLDRKEYDK